MEERFDLPTAGEILTEEFLEPLNITPYRLSKDIGVSTSSILDLVHGKRKITPEMALRFSKYFGTTSKFWLNIQNELDLREAEIKQENSLNNIVKAITESHEERANKILAAVTGKSASDFYNVLNKA